MRPSPLTLDDLEIKHLDQSYYSGRRVAPQSYRQSLVGQYSLAIVNDPSSFYIILTFCHLYFSAKYLS